MGFRAQLTCLFVFALSGVYLALVGRIHGAELTWFAAAIGVAWAVADRRSREFREPDLPKRQMILGVGICGAAVGLAVGGLVGLFDLSGNIGWQAIWLSVMFAAGVAAVRKGVRGREAMADRRAGDRPRRRS